MAVGSQIEWTEATWNPIAGCTMVSPGCTNCYAQRMAARLQAMGSEKYAGTTRKSGKRHVWTGRVNIDQSTINAPLGWKTPRRIFVNSMSDLFQEAVPTEVVQDVWKVMEAAHWHTFQILTKRPDLMLQQITDADLPTLANAWLGTSVENVANTHRIDILRKIPAAVRFVSFEPLLGPIRDPNLSGIHWAIVGGESGPRARPMDPNWAEHLRDSCVSQDVAFFFKQWGGTRKKATGRKLGNRTWDEYPEIIGPA
jgi:protein gp37